MNVLLTMSAIGDHVVRVSGAFLCATCAAANLRAELAVDCTAFHNDIARHICKGRNKLTSHTGRKVTHDSALCEQRGDYMQEMNASADHTWGNGPQGVSDAA